MLHLWCFTVLVSPKLRSSFVYDDLRVKGPVMPSTKPLLSTRVDQDLKAAFSAEAKVRMLTDAKLLELVIAAFLQRLPPAPAMAPSSPNSGTEVRSEDVRVRLAPHEYAELDRLATRRHWKRGTYLAYLFGVHLSGSPRFSEDEMLALRHITAQLSAVGRNINQIARALNISLDEAHQAQALNFTYLKNLIDQVRHLVKEVIRANLKSWGVADGDE